MNYIKLKFPFIKIYEKKLKMKTSWTLADDAMQRREKRLKLTSPIIFYKLAIKDK